MKKSISTGQAPAAIGPYSQGISACGLVFVSGQLPIDPQTGSLVHGGIGEKTAQSLKNVKSILEAAGTCMENVLKVTVFLKDMADFPDMNTAYEGFFPKGMYPARSAVQVSRLPKDAEIEIEVIAAR